MNFIILCFVSLFSFAMHSPIPFKTQQVLEAYQRLANQSVEAYGRHDLDEIFLSEGYGTYLNYEVRKGYFYEVSNMYDRPESNFFPKETRDLYAKLKMCGFFRGVGELVLDYIVLNRPHTARRKLHPNTITAPLKASIEKQGFYPAFLLDGSLDESRLRSVYILAKPDAKISQFDLYNRGFLFRKKNIENIELNLEEELENLFFKTDEIEQLYGDISEINSNLLLKLETLQSLLNQQKSEEEILREVKERFDYQVILRKIKLNDKKKYAKLLGDLKRIVDESIFRLRERITAMDRLVPAPIDAFFLFLFYYFEEHIAHYLIVKDNLDEKVLFLDSLMIEDGESIVGLLRENANYVKEIIDFDQLVIPLKKNVVKKTIKKKNKPKKQQKPPIKKKSQPIQEMKIEFLEPELPVFQVEDEPFHFNATWKERRLDTLSHLIMKQLKIDDNTVAGALSMIASNDQLIIATKRNVLRPKILAALENVFYYSEKLHSYIENAKIFIQDQKKKRERESDVFEKSKITNKIGRLKFFKTTQEAHHVFSKIFNKGVLNKDKIIVLDNLNSYHSEIAMIDYLNANPQHYKNYVQKNGHEILYQYIGNSIKTCNQCESVISKHTKDRPIYVRGSSILRYPGYYRPQWVHVDNIDTEEFDYKGRLINVNDLTFQEKLEENLQDPSSSDGSMHD